MAWLVDSHCHLDYLEREGRNLDDVVAAAIRADVHTLVTICTKVSAFDVIREIAERYDPVWCSVGIHPHEAGSEPHADADRLVALAQHPKVVGIGETGLDYYYDHSPREVQKTCFRAHIEAARRTGLPLIVHTRDADEDTVEILENEMEKGAFPGLIHCFTSSRWLAERCVKMGLSISLSGILTFKSAQDIRDTALHLPLERLLVETDSPFLAPVPNRGKQNEPAFVVHTANQLADLRGIDVQSLARITSENFFRLFSKARPPASAV